MSATQHTANISSPLLTPSQVGELLHLDPRTLANWRWRGNGPAFVRSGSRALYKLSDVQAWIDSHTYAHAAAERAARAGRGSRHTQASA